MGKTRTFHVIGNRIQFKCQECKAKRNVPVLPKIRRKNIRCHNCGSSLSCILNRRVIQREAQAGRAAIITNDGREIDVDLHDISLGGVGFDVPSQAVRLISLKQSVKFKCSWNPTLLSRGRYIVTSINGRRIGVQNLDKKLLG